MPESLNLSENTEISGIHAVLEDLFRPHVGRPLKAASLTARALDRAVEARFREFYGGDGGRDCRLCSYQGLCR